MENENSIKTRYKIAGATGIALTLSGLGGCVATEMCNTEGDGEISQVSLSSFVLGTEVTDYYRYQGYGGNGVSAWSFENRNVHVYTRDEMKKESALLSYNPVLSVPTKIRETAGYVAIGGYEFLLGAALLTTFLYQNFKSRK